jgi:hypothetical protein
MKLASRTAHGGWSNRSGKQGHLFAVLKRILPAFILFCWLLSPGSTANGDEPTAPFSRMMFLNDWGTLSSEAAVETAIDECAYMNADSIMMHVYSEYFEAVRNPNYSHWDTRASWDMVGKAITYAHSKGIQLNVWISVNIFNSTSRAEQVFFGNDHRITFRDGSIHDVRNDLACTELADYEIGLLSFIAGQYPALDGIHLEEPYYAVGAWNDFTSYSHGMRDRIEAKY